MIILLLNLLGRLLARTPEPVLRGIAVLLGEAVLWLAPGRRRLILSNLDHAFPGRTTAERRGLARDCSRRLIETGLLSLATPYLSERRIRRMARLGPSVAAWTAAKYGGGLPAGPAGSSVLATLHLALWESQTWLKLLSPVALPEFGIIFRPLNHASADAYVQRTRERFGMRLLSRKHGFAEALKILRAGGCVGVLFDQNAGHHGALTTFFGRVCSTTELPGILASKFGSEVRTFYPRRTGFWRVEFESDPIAHDGTAEGVTIALNRWLEQALADPALCPSWLWAHDRWRHQDAPAERFRLESRRNLLAADLRQRGLPALPRRTRIWIRLPNWLGDVILALPLIRALRLSRPDAEITLLAKAGFLPLLASFGVADRLHPLPARGLGYFRHFFALRRAYPDVWVLFTNSLRGDLEGVLAGAPQRFGIIRPGRPRPLLTAAYRVPPEFAEKENSQLRLWENFFRRFGLAVGPDLTPFFPVSSASAPAAPIGLIPGSENSPEKRWPPEHWRSLIAAFPGQKFVLLGTARDAAITAKVAAGWPAGLVEDLAGKTTLSAYADRLRQCRILVSNDTGGMHLANALGVPVIALFGPTNPVRTGPVFMAPVRRLQPPGCPPTGGCDLAQLAPEAVIACLREGR